MIEKLGDCHVERLIFFPAFPVPTLGNHIIYLVYYCVIISVQIMNNEWLLLLMLILVSLIFITVITINIHYLYYVCVM